jgi:hypothetical protein
VFADWSRENHKFNKSADEIRISGHPGTDALAVGWRPSKLQSPHPVI